MYQGEQGTSEFMNRKLGELCDDVWLFGVCGVFCLVGFLFLFVFVFNIYCSESLWTLNTTAG